MKKLGLLAICAVCLSFVPNVLRCQQREPSIRSLPFPEVRIGPQGEGAQGLLWLSWSMDQQNGFVGGYVTGSRIARDNACTFAAGRSTDQNLSRDCVAHGPYFTKDVNEYRKIVTDFYTRFPEDRGLPLHILIDQLGFKGMTPDKVHRWLNKLIQAPAKPSVREPGN